MERDWKGERDWWLDHFYQWSSGARRRSNDPELNVLDYVAIPLPPNVPTPLAWPCLIWRWGLSGGYGNFKSRGAHVVAYELSRGKEAGSDLNVLHLCHRPFCVQPAHLYEGTAKQNSEDMKAVDSELGAYRTWELVGDRWEKAKVAYYWPAPLVRAVSPGFRSRQALECPHWFIRPAGNARLCANCGETDPGSISGGHRGPCNMPAPYGPPPRCRCLEDPCCCKRCLAQLLGSAQRAHESAGNTIDGPLYECIPELLHDQGAPLSKEKARCIRVYLATTVGAGRMRG